MTQAHKKSAAISIGRESCDPMELGRCGAGERVRALVASSVPPQIDVSSYDLEETLTKERRRQAEALEADDMSELDQLLVPLAIAVARLTARMQIGQGS